MGGRVSRWRDRAEYFNVEQRLFVDFHAGVVLASLVSSGDGAMARGKYGGCVSAAAPRGRYTI
jgi:hypothetical protein